MALMLETSIICDVCCIHTDLIDHREWLARASRKIITRPRGNNVLIGGEGLCWTCLHASKVLGYESKRVKKSLLQNALSLLLNSTANDVRANRKLEPE